MNELQQLLQLGSQSHGGLPLRRLVRHCGPLGGERLQIDLAAAKQLGVPVVVLRDCLSHREPLVFDKLSPREQDVARLIAAGCNNAAIGRALGISITTVKDHVHHSLRKTGLRSRTELAAILAREGV